MGGGGGNFFDNILNQGNANGSQFFGGGQQSGIFGTGQYRSDMYNANPNAFAPNADEQSFIQMLQARANGQAPSAAEMQMRQGMDQATRQAQAIAASQRGISPALAARYAAQSQAGLAQQNNAQTGILRAQEQAGAMGDLGNELRSVRTGRENLESLNSGNYNQNNALNERGYTAAAANRGNMMGGLMNSIGGGMMSGAMGGGGGAAMAKGGMVLPRFADGGDVFQLPGAVSLGGSDPITTTKIDLSGGKKPQAGGSQKVAGGAGDSMSNTPATDSSGMPAEGVELAAEGGEAFEMPASVDDGGSDQVATGWNKSKGGGGGGGGGGIMSMLPMLMMAASKGAVVPGQAKVAGNSYANDTVPAVLSPGEIVLPRSVTKAENAPEKAKEFVEHILKQKSKKKSPDGPNYADVLKAHQELGKHLKALAGK